jgi:signal transduction histidine kinase
MGQGASGKRDRIVDLVLAGLVVVIAMIEWDFGGGRAVAVAVTGVALVAARRRWPVPALAVLVVATAATIVLEPMSSVLLLLLGPLTYEVTLHTSDRRSWLVACGTCLLLLTAGFVANPEQWWSLDSASTLIAWVCGSAAVGNATRSRRALLAELAERVRRAEQTREDEVHRRVMDERLRIARDLHDVVAHHIAVINVQAGAAAHVIEQHPEHAGPVLEDIRRASQTVMVEIKSVVGVLRNPGDPLTTEPAPSLMRLNDLLDGLTTIGFRLTTRIEGDPSELPAIVDQAAYRITQEALTNAHRHGDGRADLVLTTSGDAVTIEVTNHLGAHQVAGSSFGLIGMRERAAAVGGEVTAGLASDGRFHLCATLPTTLHPPGART